MKPHDWVFWIGLVALLAGGWFYFNEKKETDAVNAYLERLQRAGYKSDCNLPKVSGVDSVVFIGAAEVSQAATASLVGIEGDTEAVSIKIMPGTEKLYLVLAGSSPRIWQITGDTARVVHVAALGRPGILNSDGSMSGPLQVGVTGVAKDNITFSNTNCIISDYDGMEDPEHGNVRRRVLALRLESYLGAHDIELIGIKKTRGFTVTGTKPETLVLSNQIVPPDFPPAPAGFEWRGWMEAMSYYSDGLLKIEAADVVSPVTVTNYEILPHQFGISQLVGLGALERGQNGDVFLIKRQIAHFPPGLEGSHMVKFILSQDVPMPKGSPGHSCVRKQFTNELLAGNVSYCR